VNGTVDEAGRALVTLSLRAQQDAEPISIQAWIDTAFNGELVIPRRLIESGQMVQTAGIEARLADGSTALLEAFSCIMDWFGGDRPVEVIANEGEYPLLGIGLLIGYRLTVDYAQMTVTIESPDA
jgi:clan AA aspartic protease